GRGNGSPWEPGSAARRLACASCRVTGRARLYARASRSGEAPIADRAGRRVRAAGTSAWTAVTRKRRWPPGVTKEGIWPRSAQRRSVLAVTPRVVLASPRVSQLFCTTGAVLGPLFLAKTSQIYHPPRRHPGRGGWVRQDGCCSAGAGDKDRRPWVGNGRWRRREDLPRGRLRRP